MCILLAGFGAYLLYRKDKNLSELSSTWKRILGAFRFLSLFFLTFLLLEPLLEYTKSKVEKPILVIAQDSSESILNKQDSLAFAENLSDKINKLRNELASDYEVVSYTFGKELKEEMNVDFQQKTTNLSNVFKEIQQRYYNRNLGGIIIASDGIYNKGSNPIYEVEKLKQVPVYSIALGDTIAQKDVWIDQIIHNKLAYKGNSFPIVVEIASEKIIGESSEVQLIKNGKVLESKPINFSKEREIKQIRFETKANQTGLQKYTVTVKGVKGESTLINNTQSFYVDVLESKQQILLVANSPHPDVQAIKSAIVSNENYELKVELAENFSGNPKKYGMIITHNLPSAQYPMKKMFESKTPTLSFLGNQTDFNAYNSLKQGLSISNVKNFTEAGAYFNSKYSGFKVSGGLINSLSSFRPLQVPFSTQYQVGNSVEVAFYQRIGPAKTNYPMLGFGTANEKKVGFFVGEGIWGWRLQEYAENGSSQFVDELLQQAVQLLVAKEDKSRFKVSGKSNYELGEKVQFDAEVYNKSYELDNSGEVTMKLIDENKKEYDYQFSPQGDAYSLDAGQLSSGSYSYKATTIVDGKSIAKTGEFSINSLGLEQKNTQANHQLLYQLSSVTGGDMVSLEDINSFSQSIRDNKNLANVIYQEKEIDDLIDLKYIFFLLLLLLGVEWFVRKRNGGY